MSLSCVSIGIISNTSITSGETEVFWLTASHRRSFHVRSLQNTVPAMTVPPPPSASTARTRQIVQQIADQCDVTPDQVEDAYPCSHFQTYSFEASTQVAGMVHFNFVFKVNEPTSELFDRLTRAFSSVYEHNPLLRTRIVQYTESGAKAPRVAQAVIKQDFQWLEFDDLEHYCRERIGHCLHYGEQLVQHGISKDRKHLVWTLHHAIYDGWSLGMIWKEICNNFFAEGKQPVAEKRPKFVNFIAHLQDPMTEADRMFWNQHLAGYTGPRFDHHQLLPHTNAHHHGSLALVPTREGKVSITARIQAAWFCTLVELFRNLDVITHTVGTGRHCPVEGVADMAGPCMVSVAVRQRANLRTSLYQFVLDVAKTSSATLEHEHAGTECFQRLIEEAQRPNTIINIKTGMGGGFAGLPGLEYQPPSAQSLKAVRDWGMQVTVGEETMRWDMFLDTNRLDQDSVALVCERFPLLLQKCQTIESQDSVTLEDVIDVTRLRLST
jgi:hypothetical protein